MRWSNDGDSWSLWINFSPSDPTPITGLSFSPDTPTYLEFRFKLVSPDTASPQLPAGTEISPAVVVSGFDITLSYKDKMHPIQHIAVMSDDLRNKYIKYQPDKKENE
jgi:hypothetical protein